MRELIRRRWAWLLGAGGLAAAAAIAVAVAVSDGDGSEPAPPADDRGAGLEAPIDPGPEAGEAGEPRPEARNRDPASEPPVIDEDELSDPEREVADVVRDYVDGLRARDGKAVCELLAPGAIGELELPRERGGCASSLRASIGYRDPRGFPVWDRARVEGVLTVELEDDRASVTATTVTRFADRDEPSIEDDVIHLVREGDRWLVAKPSATLHRAVGIADVPPQVLAPPR